MLITITPYYSKKRNKKVEQQKGKSLIAPCSLMLRRIVLLLVRRNFENRTRNAVFMWQEHKGRYQNS